MKTRYDVDLIGTVKRCWLILKMWNQYANDENRRSREFACSIEQQLKSEDWVTMMNRARQAELCRRLKARHDA